MRRFVNLQLEATDSKVRSQVAHNANLNRTAGASDLSARGAPLFSTLGSHLVRPKLIRRAFLWLASRASCIRARFRANRFLLLEFSRSFLKTLGVSWGHVDAWRQNGRLQELAGAFRAMYHFFHMTVFKLIGLL